MSLVEFAPESGVRGKFIANEKIEVSSDRVTALKVGPFGARQEVSFLGRQPMKISMRQSNLLTIVLENLRWTEPKSLACPRHGGREDRPAGQLKRIRTRCSEAAGSEASGSAGPGTANRQRAADFLRPRSAISGVSISLCNYCDRQDCMRVADGTTEAFDVSTAPSGEHCGPTSAPRRAYPNYGI